MKKNMGGADRMIRFIVAIAVVALYYFNVIEGTLAYILMALAAIFVITSFVSFCPLYSLIGLNTSKEKKG
jgi:Inner membrane protein YgaP-like, transmembrane domain